MELGAALVVVALLAVLSGVFGRMLSLAEWPSLRDRERWTPQMVERRSLSDRDREKVETAPNIVHHYHPGVVTYTFSSHSFHNGFIGTGTAYVMPSGRGRTQRGED